LNERPDEKSRPTFEVDESHTSKLARCERRGRKPSRTRYSGIRLGKVELFLIYVGEDCCRISLVCRVALRGPGGWWNAINTEESGVRQDKRREFSEDP